VRAANQTARLSRQRLLYMCIRFFDACLFVCCTEDGRCDIGTSPPKNIDLVALQLSNTRASHTSHSRLIKQQLTLGLYS